MSVMLLYTIVAVFTSIILLLVTMALVVFSIELIKNAFQFTYSADPLSNIAGSLAVCMTIVWLAIICAKNCIELLKITL